ncbi:MAG TPA: RNA polymerase factor sigma-54 [Beijerinckiaceae bacterium]|jgi:RNA polymerase sigma-54 factor|nr:RNA polymerase factor sigma-54 [Beijerinckiaceae bacterium]
MALSAKLMMRQGQSLVMTPQLLQAIKLLQFSSIELASFIEEELERNPMLERVEESGGELPISEAATPDGQGSDAQFSEPDEPRESDWAGETLATDGAALEASLGTELSNTFDADRPAVSPEASTTLTDAGLSATSWTGAVGPPSNGEAANLEAYVAAKPTLHDHLLEQLALACADPVDRMIGHTLIDAVDEIGYMREDISDIAQRLGTPAARIEMVLAKIHTFEPSGVGARDLAECLAIQLRERDRYDPAMQTLIANLPLLAKREFPTLRRLCDVDDEDLADMVAEIRRLDPKPGRAYSGGPIQPVVPDVTVRAAADGGWHVELNSEVLPRLLVNQTYAAHVAKSRANDSDRSFVSQCLQTANWLTKSLEQRARTILKVSTEIVRQQHAFFAEGVQHLRPLNLKSIADAIGMHESTVSRVTSNKYMSTPRGLFELKYFFTASIAAQSGGQAHSAESVRHKIKAMIERESVGNVLSDDAIVTELRAADIDIARRTVAKYRESLRIPSSVERRREKQTMHRAF